MRIQRSQAALLNVFISNYSEQTSRWSFNRSCNSLDLFRPLFLSCVNLQGKSHKSNGTTKSKMCQSLLQWGPFFVAFSAQSVIRTMSAQRVCVSDFEEEAKKILPKAVYDYYRSGADDQNTLVGNTAAFDR